MATKINGKSKAATKRDVADIAADLMAAKAAESAANKARVTLEEEFIRVSGFDKPEGSQTFNVDDYKIVVTAKLNRKPTDLDKFVVLALKELPEPLRPIKTKVEIDQTGIKYLAQNEPDLYARIAPALVVEPAKTSVTIVRKE
jgi:hypothetical protein